MSNHLNKENMENLESLDNETYMKLDLEEDARDCSFGSRFQANRRLEQYSMAKVSYCLSEMCFISLIFVFF